MTFIDETRECARISLASSTGQCARRSRSFAVLSNFRHDRSRMGGLIGSGHLVRSVHHKEWIMTIRNELDLIAQFRKTPRAYVSSIKFPATVLWTL